MIIVSTTSDSEAMAAAYAFEESLPPDTGYEVYLNGHLRVHRPGLPEQARS